MATVDGDTDELYYYSTNYCVIGLFLNMYIHIFILFAVWRRNCCNVIAFAAIELVVVFHSLFFVKVI